MSSRFFKLALGVFFCLSSAPSLAFSLDKKESSALSHYIMGVISEDTGDLARAVEEYKEALKFDNKSASIHLNLASSYIKQNNIPQAIKELNLAIGLAPETVEPHAILALIYSATGQRDLAASEYEIALKNASKLEPQNIEIYKSLGAVYLQQKKLKDAENAYRLVLDLVPADAQAHFYLANIYQEMGDISAAKKELYKAIELEPDYAEALNFLGYLYVQEDKNLDQAEAFIKKALSIEPDNGAYIDSLGWLYFKKGKLSEAIKELERASLLLRDPIVFEHLGDAYFKTEDLAGARANWQKSLDLDPNQNNIKKKIEACNILLPK